SRPRTSRPNVARKTEERWPAPERNMAQSKSRPDSVVSVATYSELERYACAFVDGHLNLLMLCGDPGFGKSQCFRRALGGKVCWIDGNASAFGIYRQALEHRNQPIVL